MMRNPDDILIALLTANPVVALPIALGLAWAVLELLGYLFDEALLSFIVGHPVMAFMLTCIIAHLCGRFFQNLSSEETQDVPDGVKNTPDHSKSQWPAVTKCPFMAGHRYGTYQTQGMPTGTNLQACKRDFARSTAADPSDLFVVTTSESAPKRWSTLTKIDQSLEHEYSESVFAELDAWLRHSVKKPTDGLAERCVALLVNSNGLDFARKHQLPEALMMAQPKFVIMVNAKSEVRVAWFVFMSDATKLKEGILGEPFMVKMVSEDLNSTRAQLEANTQGVTFDFVTAPTIEKDMALYVQAKMSADFRRAVVDNDCRDILQCFRKQDEEILLSPRGI